MGWVDPRREEAYVRTGRVQKVRVREYRIEKVDVTTAVACERDVRDLEVREQRGYYFCDCMSIDPSERSAHLNVFTYQATLGCARSALPGHCHQCQVYLDG